MDLSHRFVDALVYAAEVHRGQTRKGTDIPYLSHLLAVSSLVSEAGGSEDEAIAGVLHDALEDQGHRTSFEQIAERFGAEVARIVRACSDTEEQPKPPGRQRKQAYLEHLGDVDAAVLRVSLADKLHNARSIASDLREHGAAVWRRFTAGSDELWYYGELARLFTERLPGPQAEELADVVTRMRADMRGGWASVGQELERRARGLMGNPEASLLIDVADTNHYVQWHGEPEGEFYAEAASGT